MKSINLADAPLGDDHEDFEKAVENWQVGTPVRVAAFTLSAVAFGLLAVAGWAGRHVRPSADDWCFLPKVRDHGVGRLVHDFYFHDNGRIANALAVGLYSRPGVAGHQVFPAVAAVAAVAVLWALAAWGCRALGVRVPGGVRPAVAGTVAALVLLAAHNPYQTFYWPAASVSHTMPPVLALGAVACALGARTTGRRVAAGGVALLTGLVLGTLSEETTVVALVALGAFLLVHRRVTGPASRRFAAVCAGCGALGLLAGLAVLATSPGSRSRRKRLGVDGSLSLREGAAAVHDWLRIMLHVATDWPYVAAVGVGALLGVVAVPVGRRPVAVGRGGVAGVAGVAGLAGRGPGAVARDEPLVGAAPPGRRPVPVVRWFLTALPALTFAAASLAATLVVRPAFGSWTSRSTRTWNDWLPLLVVLLVWYGALLGVVLGRWVRGAAGDGDAEGRLGGGRLTGGPLTEGRLKGMWLAGMRLGRRHGGLVVALGAAVVCLVGLAGLVAPTLHLAHATAARGARWDRQDVRLRAAAADGVRTPVYTPNRIGGLREPFELPPQRDWAATCVARYYRVPSVARPGR
jgi:hypothetical protein